MGWIIPDDEIARELADGLAQINDALNDNTIDDLLSRIFVSLTADQVAQVKLWLTSHDITIVRSYPTEKATFPCWSIVLDPLQQSQQYVGDLSGHFVGEDDLVYEEEAERYRASIGVITYDENPNFVRWFSHLSLWLLSRARRNLASKFPYLQQTSARDLEPVRMAGGGGEGGRFLFRRAVSITVEYDQTDVVPTDNIVDVGTNTEVLSA